MDKRIRKKPSFLILPQQISCTGFTLLEVLIALAIFLTLVVPLMGVLSRTGNSMRARDRITAACLLEQEAALVKSAGATPLVQKRRTVAEREWIIKTSVTGAELKAYRMEAWRGDRMAGEARFYVYERNSDE